MSKSERIVKGWGVCLLGVLAAVAGCDAPGSDGPRGFNPDVRNAEIAFPEEEGLPGEGRFFVGEQQESLTYEFKAGFAVHQGDIILGPEDELTPAQLGDDDVSESAVRPDRAWPDGVVHYSIGAGISQKARDAFLAGIAHWEQNSSLRFVARTDQKAFIELIEDSGCYSSVGRTGEAQNLSLGEGCTTMGIAAHELGHAIGLWHEQSRSDRDDNVVIHWDNIIEKNQHNFLTYDEQGVKGEDVGAYDTNSIMHYGPFSFAIDETKPTITRLDGAEIVRNRTALSVGDVQGAARLYGDPLNVGECAIALEPGEALVRGQSRKSCDGRFELVMQYDGNLVLYTNGTALWHSNTYNTDATFAIMQNDGNLVVYNDKSHPYWHTHTYGHPGSRLALQDDGNLVVYSPNAKPLWASDTCCR